MVDYPKQPLIFRPVQALPGGAELPKQGALPYSVISADSNGTKLQQPGPRGELDRPARRSLGKVCLQLKSSTDTHHVAYRPEWARQ